MARAVTSLRTRRRAGRASRLIALGATLSLVGMSTLYPLLFLASVALKSPQNFRLDPFGVPVPPTLDSIIDVFTRPEFVSGMVNSILICAASTLLSALVGSMAGWSLARLRLPGRNLVRGSVITLMIVPATVLIVPVFTVVRFFLLQNNPVGLVLVYAGLMLPFAIFMMTSFFQAVPTELIQAASIDGAGVVRTFVSIALPLARPALAALATLTFLNCWNDLLFSLVILQQPGQRTLQVVLTTLTNPVLATPEPTVMSGLLLSAVPNILLFALFNRQLTRGITAGAVK